MKKALALILAILTLALAAVIPIGAEPIPQNAMVATAMEQIRAHVGTDTPGAAVVLIEDGEVILSEGFGYADISQKRLITPETVFEIGDLSGLFVALAAYRLAESGALSLDENIARYLPTDFLAALDLSFPVTTKQLLLGSAGFEGRTFDLIFAKDSYRFDSLEKALLAQVPAQIALPDTFYADSPFSTALAAYVIECVAGVPYTDYVTAQVLQPLGLQQTVLLPTAETLLTDGAVGHVKHENGVFSTAVEGGRSYAGLYPASGALSSAQDLARVMEFLLSGDPDFLSEASRTALLQERFGAGLFQLSAPAMQVRNTAQGRDGQTLYFGASLWLDAAAGTGAVVLTNTAESGLLALPAALCGATTGTPVSGGEGLAELDTLRGYFASAESERSSFVGRMLRKDHNVEVTVNGDGTLAFLGMQLVQIASGVFADANGDPQVAVVQFLTDAEGKPTQIVTADGRCYLPVEIWEFRPVATLLFGLFCLLSVFFAAWGAFSLVRYFATRYDRHATGFVYVIPKLLTALIGLCSLLQLFVGIRYGGSAFCSFFGAMSVITLLLCIAAAVCFALAFAAALTRKGMTARVVRASSFFLAYVALLCYWGIMSL